MVSVMQTVFWGVTPCTFKVGTRVSEEHGASLFNVEVWISFVRWELTIKHYLQIILCIYRAMSTTVVSLLQLLAQFVPCQLGRKFQ
jgi:hypothetical protein